MKNKDIIFCQSIPVFTTHLRPYDASEKKNFKFEGTNGMYSMMSRLVAQINNDSLKIFRKKKEKNQLLYDLQMKFGELNNEIDNILSGKKGNVRQLTGGRYNFSSRNVIVQNPNLRIDQVTLPYKCLVELLQQQIVNVLQKSYNMSYNDAYSIWYKANIEKDELVVQIINGLIFANPYGLPIIINRNPTIARGGILQMFCIAMTDTFTMGIPLQILKLLAADFDGDKLFKHVTLYSNIKLNNLVNCWKLLKPQALQRDLQKCA
jgi:DNA-directed RNA polymerase beta' subunit